MKTKHFIVGVIGLCLLVGSEICADTLSVRLTDFAVIRGSLPGNSQASRVAVATPLTNLPSQSEVDFAEVIIPYFLPKGFSGILQVEAKKIARNWDKNTVTWAVPWQRAGGDFDTTTIAKFVLGKVGEVPVCLDVTEYVADWASGREGNFGVLLKRPPEEGDAFRAEIADLQRYLSQVRLKVYYHEAPGGKQQPGGKLQSEKIQQ